MYEKLQKIREEKAEGDHGFTLIELLVVVVIIGILIAIAIPLYLNYQKGAHDKSAASDLRSAVVALEQCYSENSNAYPAAITDTTANQTLACGSTNETINLSGGTHFVYTPNGTFSSYTAQTWNTGGHTSGDPSGFKTYTYNSASGGVIGP